MQCDYMEVLLSFSHLGPTDSHLGALALFRRTAGRSRATRRSRGSDRTARSSASGSQAPAQSPSRRAVVALAVGRCFIRFSGSFLTAVPAPACLRPSTHTRRRYSDSYFAWLAVAVAGSHRPHFPRLCKVVDLDDFDDRCDLRDRTRVPAAVQPLRLHACSDATMHLCNGCCICCTDGGGAHARNCPHDDQPRPSSPSASLHSSFSGGWMSAAHAPQRSASVRAHRRTGPIPHKGEATRGCARMDGCAERRGH